MKSVYRICLDSFLESNYTKHTPIKKFNIGDIVYWVGNNHVNKPHVEVGIVTDSYNGQVYYLRRFEPNFKYIVKIFDNNKNKFVELCNKEDFVNTTYYKLPKNWTYNTPLFKIEGVKEHNNEVMEQINNIDIKSTKSIKKHIENGTLKYASVYSVKIESEIDKGCFRLVRRTDLTSSGCLTKDSIYIYDSYNECQKICDKIEEENIRIANLSDYEYNVEDMNDKLDFIFKDDDIIKKKYKKYLLDKENFEDIEFRCYNGDLQWRYFKNNKWLDVDLG